jgi:putative acetyltransferase
MSPTATITTFNPLYVQQFRDLNLQWIKQYFEVEKKDTYQLENPQSTILEAGGEIFFAVEV